MKNKSKKRCVNHPDRFVYSGEHCINCYRSLYAKPLTKKPLRKISEKQKNMLVVYRMLRRKYLREHPTCEINLMGCNINAVEIHHTAKKFSHDSWLDITKFKATCRSCHQRIEASPLLAKNLGLYNFNVSNEKDFNNTDIPFVNLSEDGLPF